MKQERFIAPDGVRLVGDIAGPEEAPTVIFLHGGGQTRHSWAGAMHKLVDIGYHVINFDARGHGDSDWSKDGNYSLDARASDLRSIVSTVERPIALVGASMGGITSFYAVATSDHPIADALVMVDIVLRPAQAGVAKIHAFMRANPDGFASLEEAADAVAAYNPDRPRPKNPSGLLKNLRYREDGRLYWHWDPRMLAARPSAEPPGFHNELVKVSSRVKIPTLLVKGGNSDIVDDQGVAEMCALIPQTEVYDVPGAGHMVAGDKNDRFIDGVTGFLTRYVPPEAR